MNDWFQTNAPARLIINWNKFDLSVFESDLVDIELWGYFEDDLGPHWDFLQVVFLKQFTT